MSSYVEYDAEVEAVHAAAVARAASRPTSTRRYRTPTRTPSGRTPTRTPSGRTPTRTPPARTPNPTLAAHASARASPQVRSASSRLYDFPSPAELDDTWGYVPHGPVSPLRSLSVQGMRSPDYTPIARAASVVTRPPTSLLAAHSSDSVGGGLETRSSARLVSSIDPKVLTADAEEAAWNGTITDVLDGDAAPVIHFSMNYEDDATKFVYLTEVHDESGIIPMPYSLRVVPKSAVSSALSTSATASREARASRTPGHSRDQAYYTLSTNGITRVTNDGLTEFTPMAAFVRSATLFKHVAALPSFRYFRFWKALKLWRAFVRRRRFAANRKALLERIFILHPMFHAALRDVHAFIHGSIIPARIFALELQNTMTRSDLDAASRDALSAVKHLLSSVIDEIKARVQRLIDDIRDPARIKVSDASTTSARRTVSLRQIMLLEKQKALERARKAEMVNAELRVVGRLIRLVDYRILEALHELALKELGRLNHMAWHDNAMLLRVVLHFESDSSLSFTPDSSTVAAMFESLVSTAINTLVALPRIPFNQSFLQFISLAGMKPSSLSKDGPHLSALLNSSDAYGPRGAVALDSLARAIDASFESSAQYASLFTVVAPVHAYGVAWDPDAYKADWLEPDNLMRPLDLAPFRKDLETFTLWADLVSALHSASSRGMLLVDSKDLREDLSPVPRDCKAQVLDLLLSIVTARISALSSHLESHIYAARSEPHSLADFVAFANFLAAVPAHKDETKHLLESIDSARDLLASYNAVLPGDAASDYSMVHSLHARFLSAVSVATTRRDSLFDHYASILDSEVGDLTSAIASIRSALAAPHFASVKAIPSTLLEELVSLGSEIDTLELRASTHQDYLAALDLPPAPQLQLDDLRAILKSLSTVWSLSRDWAQLEVMLASSPFVSLSQVSLERSVLELVDRAAAAEKVLPNHPVRVTVVAKLTDLASALPTLLELANPAFQPRHWIQIFAALGESYENIGSSFTTPQLIDLGIVHHHDLAVRLSEVATGEAEIDASLDTITSFWASCKLPTVPYSPDARSVRKGVFLLAPLGELLTRLESDQMDLAKMLTSKYVSGMHGQVEALRKRLLSYSLMLQEWESLQTLWRFLDPLFTGSTTLADTLPRIAAKFKIVDRRFRMTMRSANKAVSLHDACGTPGLAAHLVEARQGLDSVMAALDSWLDARRAEFPPFGVLSNAQLLHVYALADRPFVLVKSELIGLILGLPGATLDVTPTESTAVELRAIDLPGDERLRFLRPVQAYGAPHAWLRDVLDAAKKALVSYTDTALAAYDKYLRHDWVFKFPPQVVFLIGNIMFTSQVQAALGSVASGPGEDPNNPDGPDAAAEDDAAPSGPPQESPGGLRAVGSVSSAASALGALMQTYRSQLATWSEITSSPALTNHHAAVVASYMAADMIRFDKLRALIAASVDVRESIEWTGFVRASWDPELKAPLLHLQNTTLLYGFCYTGLQRVPVFTASTHTAMGAAARAFASGAPLGLVGPPGAGKGSALTALALTAGRRLLTLDARALAAPHAVTAGPAAVFRPLARFLRTVARNGYWGCVAHAAELSVSALVDLAGAAVALSRSLALGQSSIASGRDAPHTAYLAGLPVVVSPSTGLAITLGPNLSGPPSRSCADVLDTLPPGVLSAFTIHKVAVPDSLFLLEVALYAAGFRAAKSLAATLFVLQSLLKSETEPWASEAPVATSLSFLLRAVSVAARLRSAVPSAKESVVLMAGLTRLFRSCIAPHREAHVLSIMELVFVRKAMVLPESVPLVRALAIKASDMFDTVPQGTETRKHPAVALCLRLYSELSFASAVLTVLSPNVAHWVEDALLLLADLINGESDAAAAAVTDGEPDDRTPAVDDLAAASESVSEDNSDDRAGSRSLRTPLSWIGSDSTPPDMATALIRALPQFVYGGTRVVVESHDLGRGTTRNELVGYYRETSGTATPTGLVWVPGRLALILGALASRARLAPSAMFVCSLSHVPMDVVADVITPAAVQIEPRPPLASAHPDLTLVSRVVWANGEALVLPPNIRLVINVGVSPQGSAEIPPSVLLAMPRVSAPPLTATESRWLWYPDYVEWVASLGLTPERTDYLTQLASHFEDALAAYISCVAPNVLESLVSASAASSSSIESRINRASSSRRIVSISNLASSVPSSRTASGSVAAAAAAAATASSSAIGSGSGFDSSSESLSSTKIINAYLEACARTSSSSEQASSSDEALPLATVTKVLLTWLSGTVGRGTLASQLDSLFGMALIRGVTALVPSSGWNSLQPWMSNLVSRLIGTLPDDADAPDVYLDKTGVLTAGPDTPVQEPHGWWDRSLVACFEWLARSLDGGHSVMVSGPRHGSKAWLVDQYASRHAEVTVLRISLREPGWAARLPAFLEAHLVRYTANVLGAPAGSRVLIVVDDVGDTEYTHPDAAAVLDAVCKLATKTSAGGRRCTSAFVRPQPMLGTVRPGMDPVFPRRDGASPFSGYYPVSLLADDQRLSATMSGVTQSGWESGLYISLQSNVQFVVLADGATFPGRAALLPALLPLGMGASHPERSVGILRVHAFGAMSHLSGVADTAGGAAAELELDTDMADTANAIAEATASVLEYFNAKVGASALHVPRSQSLASAVGIMKTLGSLASELPSPQLVTRWWLYQVTSLVLGGIKDPQLASGIQLKLESAMEDAGLILGSAVSESATFVVDDEDDVDDDDARWVRLVEPKEFLERVVSTRASKSSTKTARWIDLALPWLALATPLGDALGSPLVPSARVTDTTVARVSTALSGANASRAHIPKDMAEAETHALVRAQNALTAAAVASTPELGELARLCIALHGPHADGRLVLLHGSRTCALAATRTAARLRSARLVDLAPGPMYDVEQTLRMCYMASGMESRRLTLFVSGAALEQILESGAAGSRVLALLLSPSSAEALRIPLSKTEFEQAMGVRAADAGPGRDVKLGAASGPQLRAQFAASVRSRLRIVFEISDGLWDWVMAREQTHEPARLLRVALGAPGRNVVSLTVSRLERDPEAATKTAMAALVHTLPWSVVEQGKVTKAVAEISVRLGDTGETRVPRTGTLVALAAAIHAAGLVRCEESSHDVALAQMVLERAGERLVSVRADIAKYEPQVQAQVQEAEELRAAIAANEKRLAETRAAVNEAELQVESSRQSRDAQKAFVDSKLAAVEPEFVKYQDRLRMAQVEDVIEVGLASHPPDGLVFTMEAICALSGIETPSWKDVMTLTSEENAATFLDWVSNYSPALVTDSLRTRVRRYVKHDATNLKDVTEGSPPLGGDLCGWLLALYEFVTTEQRLRAQRSTITEFEYAMKDAAVAVEQGQIKQQEISERLARLRAQQEALSQTSLQDSVSSSMERLKGLNDAMAAIAPLAECLNAQAVEVSTRRACLAGDALVVAALAVYGDIDGLSTIESAVRDAGMAVSQAPFLAHVPPLLAEKALSVELMYGSVDELDGSSSRSRTTVAGVETEEDIGAMPPSALMQRVSSAARAYVDGMGRAGAELAARLVALVHSPFVPVVVDPDNVAVPAIRAIEAHHEVREIHLSDGDRAVSFALAKALTHGQAVIVHGVGKELGEAGVPAFVRALIAGTGYLPHNVVSWTGGDGSDEFGFADGDEHGDDGDADDVLDGRTAAEMFEDLMRMHARPGSFANMEDGGRDGGGPVLVVPLFDGDGTVRKARGGARVYLVSREPEVAVSSELSAGVSVFNFSGRGGTGAAVFRAQLAAGLRTQEAGVVADLAGRLASETHLLSSVTRETLEMLIKPSYTSGDASIVDEPETLSALSLSLDTMVSTTATVLKLQLRMRKAVHAAIGPHSKPARALVGMWKGARSLSGGRVGLEKMRGWTRVVSQHDSAREGYVPRGVFKLVTRDMGEQHALLLAFMAAAEVMSRASGIRAIEWRVLVKGKVVLDEIFASGRRSGALPPKPRESWLSSEMWRSLVVLEGLGGVYDGLLRSVTRETELWYTFVHSSAPLAATTAIPPILDRMTPLQRMVMVRLLRPDMVETAMRSVVHEALGGEFEDVPEIKLQRLWRSQWSGRRRVPLVFVVDEGRQIEWWLAQWWRDTELERKSESSVSSGPVVTSSEAPSVSEALPNDGGDAGAGGGSNSKARVWYVTDETTSGFPSSVDAVVEELGRGSWFVIVCGKRTQRAMYLAGRATQDASLSGGQGSGRVFVVAAQGHVEWLPVAVARVSDVVSLEWSGSMRRSLLTQYSEFEVIVGSGTSSAVRVLRRVLFGLALFVGHVSVRAKLPGVMGWVSRVVLHDETVRQALEWMNQCLETSIKPDVDDDEHGGFLPWDDLRSVMRHVLVSTFCEVDATVANAVIESTMGEFLFDDHYMLSPSLHTLHPPPSGTLSQHAEFVENAFPMMVPLDVLGLRNKASLHMALARVDATVEGLARATASRPRARLGIRAEAQLAPLTAVMTIVQGIRDELAAKLPERGGFVQPMFDNVLDSEAKALDVVLGRVHDDVHAVFELIRGRAAMSTRTYALWLTLGQGRVPSRWRLLKSDPWDIGLWLDLMKRRVSQTSLWKQHGLPVVLNAGLLAAPRKLLARLLVAASKASGEDAPLSNYGFDFVVQRPGVTPREHPPVGVYLGSLVLDNAAWDVGQKVLNEVPGHTLSTPMPVIWVRPVNVTLHNKDRLLYTAPLYGVFGDESIVDVTLPVSGDETFWRLLGVRLRCE